MNETDLNELAALYIIGALTDEEYHSINDRLSRGWPEFERLLTGYESTLEGLSREIEPVTPPDTIKDRLMQSLPKRSANHGMSGMRFQFADDASFVDTSYPGISVRVLHIDRARKQFTTLMRVAPGAKLPGHHHDGPEECIVLDGSIRIGNVTMKKGDYQRAESDSDHVDQWSETGALLYLTVPLSLINMG